VALANRCVFTYGTGTLEADDHARFPTEQQLCGRVTSPVAESAGRACCHRQGHTAGVFPVGRQAITAGLVAWAPSFTLQVSSDIISLASELRSALTSEDCTLPVGINGLSLRSGVSRVRRRQHY
jgi:hypothetical protein